MDWNKLLSEERIGGRLEENYPDLKYGRSEYEKDYSRIVASASFRRLQDKTQVFPLDSSDFVRTRLTHSLEVASFAKELGEMVVKYLQTEKGEGPQVKGIPDILMCAGMLHDIGNPPFGHFGETVIGDWYKSNLSSFSFCGKTLEEIFPVNSPEYCDFCNFEGNAQAFRLLSKLHFIDSDCGLNLTSAVLNTIVKYPCSSKEKDGAHEDIKYHKMGYFQGDLDYFQKITENTGTAAGRTVYRHPLTFLLEAADDIAYATADLEDGFKKGMFTLDEFIQFLNDEWMKYEPEMSDKYQKQYTKELFDKLGAYREQATPEIKKSVGNKDLYAMQNWTIYVQGWFTYCACYGFKKNYDEIMKGTYTKEIMQGTNHEFSLKILKNAMRRFIYPQPQILKLELAADSILSELLGKFIHAVIYYDYKCPADLSDEERSMLKPGKADEKLIRLLPDNYLENYKLEAEGKTDEEKLYYRILLVNDFISGMTDSYAKSLYQELIGIY